MCGWCFEMHPSLSVSAVAEEIRRKRREAIAASRATKSPVAATVVPILSLAAVGGGATAQSKAAADNAPAHVPPVSSGGSDTVPLVKNMVDLASSGSEGDAVDTPTAVAATEKKKQATIQAFFKA